MAKDVTFVESHELLELAGKLKERYYYLIGHIDLDLIYFAEMLGEKPKKAKIGQVSGISSTWVKMLLSKSGKNNKIYCMSVWGNEWSNLGPSTKQWVVFKLLYAIDPAMEGKLRKPDIQDFGPIQEYFSLTGVGPYWEKKDALPDMLNGDPLAIPPPPDEETGDSTVED